MASFHLLIFLLVDEVGAGSHFVHGEHRGVLPHEQVQVLAGLVHLRLELVHPLPQRILHLIPLVTDPGLGQVKHSRHVLRPVEDSAELNLDAIINNFLLTWC